MSKISSATLARWRVLTIAAALFASASAPEIASANAISYTGYSWIGDTIHISSPRAVTSGAGQIQLTGVTGGSLSTVVAWCLDILHDLQGQGTYTIGGPLASAGNLIGGLMMEGNNYLAQAGST